jgi:drug/metabolite transporter (DMT)-like permease
MWSLYFIVVTIAALVSIPLLFFDLGEYKKLHKIILSILVTIALLENWCNYLVHIGKTNVQYYNAIFVYTIPILYLYFFRQVFTREKEVKALQFMGGFFLLFSIIKTFFLTPFSEFHHDSYVLGSLLIIGCCLYFFYGIINRNLFIETDLLLFPVFWIVTFLLFKYSSSILNFASIKYVTSENFELMSMMQQIINGLSATTYLVFALSFYIPLIKNKKSNLTHEPG